MRRIFSHSYSFPPYLFSPPAGSCQKKTESTFNYWIARGLRGSLFLPGIGDYQNACSSSRSSSLALRPSRAGDEEKGGVIPLYSRRTRLCTMHFLFSDTGTTFPNSL